MRVSFFQVHRRFAGGRENAKRAAENQQLNLPAAFFQQ